MKKTLGFIMFLIAAFFVYFVDEEPVDDKQKVQMKEVEETTQVNANDKLQIHYIDVGQGDAIFIELPNDRTMLIDAGESYKADIVLNYIL